MKATYFILLLTLTTYFSYGQKSHGDFYLNFEKSDVNTFPTSYFLCEKRIPRLSPDSFLLKKEFVTGITIPDSVELSLLRHGVLQNMVQFGSDSLTVFHFKLVGKSIYEDEHDLETYYVYCEDELGITKFFFALHFKDETLTSRIELFKRISDHGNRYLKSYTTPLKDYLYRLELYYSIEFDDMREYEIRNFIDTLYVDRQGHVQE